MLKHVCRAHPRIGLQLARQQGERWSSTYKNLLFYREKICRYRNLYLLLHMQTYMHANVCFPALTFTSFVAEILKSYINPPDDMLFSLPMLLENIHIHFQQKFTFTVKMYKCLPPLFVASTLLLQQYLLKNATFFAAGVF